MTEYTREIKNDMEEAARSGKWSRIHPLLQQHGPELATVALSSKVGLTVLHYIAIYAPDVPTSTESIRNLCAIKAVNIDTRASHGYTPLHLASWNGKVHQVRTLLRCEAIAYVYNNDGDSPMSECCGYGIKTNKPIILSLLKNPPRTYIQELIDKRNILAMILNKRISIGTKQDIKQLLISIGY